MNPNFRVVNARECEKCNRPGFLWSRNYCSYCGFIDSSLNVQDLDVQRAARDKLYDDEFDKGVKMRALKRAKAETDSGERFYSSSELGI